MRSKLNIYASFFRHSGAAKLVEITISTYHLVKSLHDVHQRKQLHIFKHCWHRVTHPTVLTKWFGNLFIFRHQELGQVFITGNFSWFGWTLGMNLVTFGYTIVCNPARLGRPLPLHTVSHPPAAQYYPFFLDSLSSEVWGRLGEKKRQISARNVILCFHKPSVYSLSWCDPPLSTDWLHKSCWQPRTCPLPLQKLSSVHI